MATGFKQEGFGVLDKSGKLEAVYLTRVEAINHATAWNNVEPGTCRFVRITLTVWNKD